MHTWQFLQIHNFHHVICLKKSFKTHSQPEIAGSWSNLQQIWLKTTTFVRGNEFFTVLMVTDDYFYRTRQIARCRVTTTICRPQININRDFCLKWRDGATKPKGTYEFDKVWSIAQDGRFRKLFLIRVAYYFEKKIQTLCINRNKVWFWSKLG